MTDITPEEASKEAVHAVKNAQQAVELARSIQLEEHLSVEKMAEAFRRVLSDGVDGKQRVILLKRIPIICNDILQIKADLGWIKWIAMAVGGLVIAQFLKTFLFP